jgi:hypothetical protein
MRHYPGEAPFTSVVKPLKTLVAAVVGTVVGLAALLLVVRTTGLNPRGPRPGLWLSGELVTAPVEDWSFANSYPLVEVQTNTWYGVPHSVTIYCVSYQKHLYLQSIGKTWKRNVAHDPHVRIKIGNQLYDRLVAYVSDVPEYSGVEQSLVQKYGGTPAKEFRPNAYLRVLEK